MSHKTAKKARRMAREMTKANGLVDAPQTHITRWKPATIRTPTRIVRTERPQVVMHPHSLMALAKRLKKELENKQ